PSATFHSKGTGGSYPPSPREPGSAGGGVIAAVAGRSSPSCMAGAVDAPTLATRAGAVPMAPAPRTSSRASTHAGQRRRRHAFIGSAPRRVVGLLGGGDRQGEAVLVRWQWAGGERRECARRAVGAVEVRLQAPSCVGARHVQEPAGPVAAMSVGAVGEDQEQLL